MLRTAWLLEFDQHQMLQTYKKFNLFCDIIFLLSDKKMEWNVLSLGPFFYLCNKFILSSVNETPLAFISVS